MTATLCYVNGRVGDETSPSKGTGESSPASTDQSEASAMSRDRCDDVTRRHRWSSEACWDVRC